MATSAAFATFAVGWAPALLVAPRPPRGVAAGGERGGAVLMLAEHPPPDRSGFYGSWPQMASSAALIAATRLVAWAGGATWPLSLYRMAVGAVAFVATLWCRETAYRRVGGVRAGLTP